MLLYFFSENVRSPKIPCQSSEFKLQTNITFVDVIVYIRFDIEVLKKQQENLIKYRRRYRQFEDLTYNNKWHLVRHEM